MFIEEVRKGGKPRKERSLRREAGPGASGHA
jgi:hypothetical protein